MRLYTKDDFPGMRAAGKLVAKTLEMIESYVQPGVTTEALNTICEDFIRSHNAFPAPLEVGFPKAVCTSPNHVVCHGVPCDKKLKDGDILNIDVSLKLGEHYGDSCRMYKVGNIGIKAQKLIDTTYEAFLQAIEVCKPGAFVGDIGHAIQSYVEPKGYSVVRDFCGHGIGKVLHDKPNIMHFGKPGTGIELKEGMFFTIEPMINEGGWDVKELQDGWTIVTRDRSLSAQFEHTLAIVPGGYEIFTTL